MRGDATAHRAEVCVQNLVAHFCVVGKNPAVERNGFFLLDEIEAGS